MGLGGRRGSRVTRRGAYRRARRPPPPGFVPMPPLRRTIRPHRGGQNELSPPPLVGGGERVRRRWLRGEESGELALEGDGGGGVRAGERLGGNRRAGADRVGALAVLREIEALVLL